MGFREYIFKLEEKNKLTKINKSISKKLESSGIIKALGEKPVLFENLKESDFRVAANIFPTKESIASYLGTSVEELIPMMVNAIENPSKPGEVTKAPCQEVEMDVDLNKIPILFHCEQDGGNYISSGVFIITDKDYGQNVDFHRCMQIDKSTFCP